MQLELSLSKWQQEVFFDKHRFKVISAGRQSGKTDLCVKTICCKALTNHKSINWWVAPTYDPAKMAFRRCITYLIDNKIQHDMNRSELRITLLNGSVIQFRSGDREEGLRGETVNFMVIDEMGLLKRDAWEYALRGTITVTKAEVIFIGTPKGKNLFYELYCKGQDTQETEYKSWQLESIKSEFFPKDEWEVVQRLPLRVFQQEYQAAFIDDGGEVFRNVRECVRGELEDWKSNKTYYGGVDLAKSHDYTVITIFDQYGHMVYYDRFNDIAWTVQKQRIINAFTKYHAHCLIDSTGLGDPILDDLLAHIRVEGFKFSNTSKRQIIENLAITIEKEEISFPEIPELINELNTFTFEQSESGVIRYSAPEGLHDDIVISLALSNWLLSKYRFSVLDFTDIEGREFK